MFKRPTELKILAFRAQKKQKKADNIPFTIKKEIEELEKIRESAAYIIIGRVVRSYLDSLEESKNRCIICNIDMGDCNPRQLCGKWCCENEII